MRRTKIIVTLGPAVAEIDKMRDLVRAGSDVARLNTAHGSVESHRKMLEMFRRVSKENRRFTGAMLDIKGPEIRTSTCRKDTLIEGDTVTIAKEGDISFNHDIYKYIVHGTKILIHDGDIVLSVEKLSHEINAKVIRGGKITPKMGVNVPGVKIPLPYIQERDVEFLNHIRDIDFIGASFVRNARDISEIRKLMGELDIDASIIAKIENQEGVDNIDDILEVSDGIMVARGDLGTEIPVENLPGVQKYLLRKAREHGKIGIIATQILESMLYNPYPTRAEVSDIANSILDGADALMLSGETAIGANPVNSVMVLSRVSERADELLVRDRERLELQGTISESVSNAAVLLAREIHANSLLVLTRSGKTARLISRHRPPMPILAVTPDLGVLRRTSLYWGVVGFNIKKFEHSDRAVKGAMSVVSDNGPVNRGDILVIVGGEPSGVPGTTNFVWAQIVGDIVARGSGFGTTAVRGKICHYPDICDIVVCTELINKIDLNKIKAIIIESRIYDPCMLRGFSKQGKVILAGTGKIKDDLSVVTVDPVRGVIWK